MCVSWTKTTCSHLVHITPNVRPCVYVWAFVVELFGFMRIQYTVHTHTLTYSANKTTLTSWIVHFLLPLPCTNIIAARLVFCECLLHEIYYFYFPYTDSLAREKKKLKMEITTITHHSRVSSFSSHLIDESSNLRSIQHVYGHTKYISRISLSLLPLLLLLSLSIYFRWKLKNNKTISTQ